MPHPLRRIKKAKITFISLCPKGVNKLPVIYKEEDNSLVLNPIVKAGDDFTEKGELLVIAYPSEKVDSQGDIASKGVVKAMAYDYMKCGGQIDIRHDGKALGRDQIFIAENFMVQKGDPRFSGLTDYEGNEVDATDSWGLVLKVEDENLRKLYNNGDWAGVSIFGSAEFEKPDGVNKAEQILQDLISKMNPKEPEHTQEDIFMTITKEDLKEIFTAQTEAIGKTVADAIEKARVPTEAEKLEKLKTFAKELGIEIPDSTKPTKPVKTSKVEKEEEDLSKAPVFSGDPTDAEALTEHTFQLKQYELRKDVDWEDADSVSQYGEALAELQKEDEEASGKKRKKPAASKDPKKTISKDTESDFFDAELSKEEIEGLAAGEEVAKIFAEENKLYEGSTI